jgi:hypothetical protein
VADEVEIAIAAVVAAVETVGNLINSIQIETSRKVAF